MRAKRTRGTGSCSQPADAPRTLPGAEGLVYFRTLDDYHFLRRKTAEGSRVVVIGGGFIGSEIAAALTANGRKVTMVFPDPGIAARLLPAPLSAFVTEYYRERGVEVLAEETVVSAGPHSVTTGSGRDDRGRRRRRRPRNRAER